MSHLRGVATFNSPLEAGIRAVGILLEAYPVAYDIQRIVAFDFLVVHTGDVGGPTSMHPQVPGRTAELLVRRQLVERGLLLMMSRGLIERGVGSDGITYVAGDLAETFYSSLTSTYLKTLRQRCIWVVGTFGELRDDEIRARIGQFFEQWIEEFESAQKSLEGQP